MHLTQDTVAIQLTPPYRIAVVGSPAYFAEREPPITPHELSEHLCLNYRWAMAGQLARWAFTGRDGMVKIDVEGALVINDTGLLRDAVLAGVGLARLPEAAFEPVRERGARPYTEDLVQALSRVLSSPSQPASNPASIAHADLVFPRAERNAGVAGWLSADFRTFLKRDVGAPGLHPPG